MEGGIVMDGRDIGTVVFPAAQCKIFLTASVEERALRRGKELAAKGEAVNYEQLRTAIARRDKEDSERAVSPLRQAEDAIYLDTTEMDITQVTEEILRLVNLAQKMCIRDRICHAGSAWQAWMITAFIPTAGF